MKPLSENTRLALAASSFLLVAIGASFIAWCAGYDFDHRDVFVGFYVAMSLLIAVSVSFGFYSSMEDK